MSLLNDLVQEMAAAGSTGAANIAANPYTSGGGGGSLFGGGVVDMKKEGKKRRKMIRRLGISESKKLSFIQSLLSESLGVDLGGSDFDASDVISRIEAASKKEEQNEDTIPFGMEDEDGNMVKVYVRSDQADDFEKKLAAMLASEDEDDDDDNSALEIAEVLFKLKDEFEIVDVEWPAIEGDEEEEQEVAGTEATPAQGAAGELPPEGQSAEGGDMENLDGESIPGEEDMGMGDEASAKSALDSVIDMMKADAEAKKAEADARAAEARAKEAEFAAQAAASKIRKEEQILDMETSEKEAKEQEKEAQQLAKLARFQHQKAQDAEVKLSMESKEDHHYTYDDPYQKRHEELDKDGDSPEDDNEITIKELSYLIMRNLSHNG